MSLIHWWPLTGHFQDKAGTNNIDASNVTFAANGKIGKAALFDNDNDILKINNLAELSSLNTYSMSCWIYLTNTATNHSSAFLSSGDWNTPNEQVCFGVYNYNNGYNVLLVPNASGWSTGINISSNKIQLNTWYHIVITYDGLKTNAYINGTYVGSYSGGGINTNSIGYYYLGGATYYRGFTMKGRMNDFRIYNHTLSTKEIKELSKALVLHYAFDTPLYEQELVGQNMNEWTDTYYYTYDGSGTTQGYYYMEPDGSVRCVDNSTNSRFQYMIQPSMQQGDTFEVSIKYKQLTGAQAFRWQIQELDSSGAVVKTWWSVGEPEVQQEFLVADGWKLIKYIFTVSNTATTKARFWIQGGQDYVKYTRSFQLKDFKIHKITNKIGDSSGLGNSGTLVSPQYYSFTNDTILGTRALYSRGDDNGSAYIDTTLNPSFISGGGTICFWYKKDSSSTNFLVATPRQTAPSKYLWANSPGSTPWNSGASYSSWYIDGIEKKSVAEANTNWHFYCITGVDLSTWSTFTMHCHSDGEWLYRGKIADFRVYNTVLSESDIKELYNVRWAANQQGRVFSCAINEGQPTHQITRSGVVNCSELNEISLPSGYQRIEYIQSAGSSYIDTGVAPGTALRFRTIVSDISSSAYVITQGNYGLRDYWSTFVNFVSGRRFKGSITNTPGVRYVITGNNDGIWINGVAGVQETDNDSPSGNVKLMASGSGKMYECMLWNGNRLVRVFVPVIAPDGTPCMYDYITKRCYSSPTGTAFTAGGNMASQVQYDKNGNIYCTEFNET